MKCSKLKSEMRLVNLQNKKLKNAKIRKELPQQINSLNQAEMLMVSKLIWCFATAQVHWMFHHCAILIRQSVWHQLNHQLGLGLWQSHFSLQGYITFPQQWSENVDWQKFGPKRMKVLCSFGSPLLGSCPQVVTHQKFYTFMFLNIFFPPHHKKWVLEDLTATSFNQAMNVFQLDEDGSCPTLVVSLTSSWPTLLLRA